MSAIALFACAATGASVNFPHPPEDPGIHDVEVTLDTGERARLTLSLPTGGVARRAPLVLILHYAGQPTRYYGRPLLEELVEPALRSLGAIHVAPESRDGPWHSEKNEAFVMQLIEALGLAYDFDDARVVVAGYSMGAMGVWHMLSHYPGQFSAAIPVSGFPNSELSCDVPVYALHAPADELFSFARLADIVAEMKARDCPIHLHSVDAQGHFDLQGFRTALEAVPAWLRGVWETPERTPP